MDYQLHKNEQRIRIYRIRNFQTNRTAVPLRAVPYEGPGIEKFMMYPNSFCEVGDTYFDEKGHLRCEICHLISTEAPCDMRSRER